MTLMHGDCREQLKTLPDASVDSIVTDPPYELGFMGKRWDSSGIAYDQTVWEQCLRVLKPGGHLLAFGGTRTYHRMVVAIEDAGFEIRDSIHWLYGSGFPKSLDVSKAIDKMAGHWKGRAGSVVAGNAAMESPNYARTAKGEPVTSDAVETAGWGTALKPAHEPIVVARKPLAGTVAVNMLNYGTGALNIDGCRVGNDVVQINTYSDRHAFGDSQVGNEYASMISTGRWPANIVFTHAADCDDDCGPGCPVAELDSQSGYGRSTPAPLFRGATTGTSIGGGSAFGVAAPQTASIPYNDSGGASRFFTVTEWDTELDATPFVYIPKPGKRERNAGLHLLPTVTAGEMTNRTEGTVGIESPRAGAGRTGGAANFHPTVKPVALMRHLIRLVTPAGGTVLDPFLGSGTTAVAATLEHTNWIGCELTADYLPIIEARVRWAEEQMVGKLFD